MFFDGWYGVLRVLVVGTIGYVALVLVLRTSGKRTLSKLNAFDFVVTVALGSTLATVLLSSSVSLAEGVTAIALLTGLQYLVTFSSVRSAAIRRAVRAEPTLLVLRGEVLPGALRQERVTESELRQAARQGGHPSLDDVDGLVLESDGSFSVLASPPTVREL